MHPMIKVYRYGLLPPTINESLVLEQMRAARRYYNTLIEIERARRSAKRASLETHLGLLWLTWAANFWSEECATLTRKIKAQRAASRKRSESTELRDQLDVAKVKRRDAMRTLAFGRALVKASSSTKAIDDNANERIRNARKHENCGVYWGTYQLSEDSAKQAAKMPLYDGSEPTDPSFSHRRDGRVSVQLQGGMTTSEVMSGEDTQLRIRPNGTSRGGRRQFAVLSMRVGSHENKTPIWSEWPMVLDRQLPPEARIKRATVLCRVDGQRWPKWFVDITVEMPSPAERSGLAVGVDIGWRLINDELRVAYWHGEDGQDGELRLDKRWTEGMSKVESIRAIRDMHLNRCRAMLVAWLQEHKDELPEWLLRSTVRRSERVPSAAQAVAYIAEWKSPARFVSLCRRWWSQPFPGDDGARLGLEQWRRRDTHLWDWERNMRSNLLDQRMHLYKNFAAMLVKRYATVVLEKFDLRAIAEREELSSKSDNKVADANRVRAALSTMRGGPKTPGMMEHVFTSLGGKCVKVNPAGTTITCHHCGAAVTSDPAATVTLSCEAGHVFDQDANAARNILSRGVSDGQTTPPPRNDGNNNNFGNEQGGKWARAKRQKQERIDKIEALATSLITLRND